MFVSRVRLERYKTLPVASAPWALDSGGFSELAKYSEWTVTAAEYAAEVRRYADEVGRLEWAAPQDWMCEPFMLHGRTVTDHQRRTVNNFCELRHIGTAAPVIPVLQGWTLDDYLRCVDLYEQAGVSLENEQLVGLGSVCRRQATGEIEAIVHALQPLRLHGFGVKMAGFQRYGALLESADSMAWSYNGRRNGTCAQKSRCANCKHWAMEWRERLLEPPMAPTLWST